MQQLYHYLALKSVTDACGGAQRVRALRKQPAEIVSGGLHGRSWQHFTSAIEVQKCSTRELEPLHLLRASLLRGCPIFADQMTAKHRANVSSVLRSRSGIGRLTAHARALTSAASHTRETAIHKARYTQQTTSLTSTVDGTLHVKIMFARLQGRAVA